LSKAIRSTFWPERDCCENWDTRQADPGKNTITLLVNDFINNTLDSMVLETAAGKAHFIQAKPGMFGAFTLVELDEEAGMREVSYTEFYQTN
jgi:hypothetical protein